MADLSVIYYTSNREDEGFESRIRRTLWRTIKPLGLPLISVSQKPIDFGVNICVGEVGSSSHNAWRQFQIGAQLATTEFVCTAEADTLYPREYFTTVRPVKGEMQCVLPMYVLTAMRNKVRAFHPKRRGSFCASISNRVEVISAIEETLSPFGKWAAIDERDYNYNIVHNLLKIRFVKIPMAVVSIKTDQCMHRGTPKWHGVVRELPNWGEADGLIRKYLR